MNNNEMLAIFDREVRRECEWTRMEREVFPNLVRYTETDNPNGSGFISWSALNEKNVDAAIEEQRKYFGSIHMELEWKVYTQDQPANLDDRLLSYGFKPDDPDALMVAEMDDLPADYWVMDVSAVSRITTPEGVDEITRMESEVWAKDISGFVRGMKYDLEHHPDHLSVFAVWQDGRIVSAAWTHYLLSTSFATLWGGSTLKEYRRKGFYTALLAARAREARDRGFRFLQVDASPDSQPILAKHGFRCLGFSRAFIWKP